MKRIMLSALLAVGVTATRAQNKFDLQKPTYGVDIRATYLKGKQKQGDPAEIMTSLPAYSTYDVEGFTYGPVAFTHGSDLGNSDTEASNIAFLIRSAQERVLVGMIITINKTAEAKKLAAYINQKYGKSIVLAQPPKPNRKGETLGIASYLWKNIQPGVSLILSDEFSLKDNKPARSTTLYVIQNDVKTNPNLPGFKTVLDKLIRSTTRT